MQESKLLALNMIVKDDTEADMLHRCLRSFEPYVDAMYICGTGFGPKGKIKRITEKMGGVFKEITPETNPEVYHDFGEGMRFAHFGQARNAALEMVPDDFSWVVWADTDDVLEGGAELRDVAKVADERKADAVCFTYWYSVILDDDGRVDQVVVDHIKERIFKKRIFQWKDRLHENIYTRDSGYKPVVAEWPFNPELGQKVVWVHLDKGMDGKQERNAPILELQAQERGDSDPRDFHYLGKTYADMGKLDKAKEYFKRHLEKSGWNQERAISIEYLALIAQQEKNYRESVDILIKGLGEYPMNHMLYLRLAAAYFELGQVDFAKHWINVAEHLPQPTSNTAITNQYEIKTLLTALKIKEAMLKPDLAEVEKWAEIRHNLMGHKDDGLLEDVKETKALNYAVTGLFNLSKWLKEHDYGDKIAPIVTTMPEEITDEPSMRIITKNILPAEKWPEKSIAYVCTHGGPHFEKWNFKSVEKGIGGSETAVIELSKRWAKAGYKVVVYADTDMPGMHEGVEWRQPWQLNWKDEFDTVIIWRMTFLLDEDIKAKHIYVDLHDVTSQLDFTDERMDKIDGVFFKSNYHRRFVPKLPDSKVRVVSNGI